VRIYSSLLLSVACVALSAPAFAQTDAASESATVNLIRLLVKQHVITQKNADALLKEAESEAASARAAAATPAPQPVTETQSPPPPAPGVVRVPYVPEIVKNQIRDEVKEDVLKQAKNENWAQPEAVPAWTKRITWMGDFRFRDEFDLYSKTNDNELIDYATLNSSGPIDINSDTNPNAIPLLNTTQNRIDQLSLRLHLGMIANVADGVLVGVRIATGKDDSPVSTTQLLGGGLDKKAIWLDQAYITLKPFKWDWLTFGRMPDPFLRTDLVYDDNLNFDGAIDSVQTKEAGAQGLGGFATLGAFPLEYVASGFPTNSFVKSPDRTKWLLAAQIGTDWTTEKFDWQFGVAYYDFQNLQGQLSAPCATYAGIKQCSTDPTKPAFMQKGNTLFLIRNITPNPSSPTDYAQPQFVGLAENYDELDATSEFTTRVSSHYNLVLDADFVRNMAYEASAACRYAPAGLPLNNVTPGTTTQTIDGVPETVENFDPCDPQTAPNTKARLDSGQNAWMLKATFGVPKPRAPWEWNVSFGYKYIQPDAVVDAFNDHDFHQGGTNAKGYFVGASLGLFDNTWLTARWLSANEVSGPPLAIDVLQLDLNASF
jgi:hypothetical protein